MFKRAFILSVMLFILVPFMGACGEEKAVVLATFKYKDKDYQITKAFALVDLVKPGVKSNQVVITIKRLPSGAAPEDLKRDISSGTLIIPTGSEGEQPLLYEGPFSVNDSIFPDSPELSQTVFKWATREFSGAGQAGLIFWNTQDTPTGGGRGIASPEFSISR